MRFICALLFLIPPFQGLQGYGHAQSFEPQIEENEIKPKFGKPPKSNQTQRITVTIGTKDKPKGASAPSEPHQDARWFWNVIEYENRTGIGIDDFQDALSGARQQMSIQPTLEQAASLINEYRFEIMSGAGQFAISPALVAAIIWVESAGQKTVKSSAGASGLMQLMPETAKRFNVKNSIDPEQNILGGSAYLNWLLDYFNGDPILALAGYNAGENAVGQNGRLPDYPQTRAYVPKVLAAYSVFMSLCNPRPLFPRDACIFEQF